MATVTSEYQGTTFFRATYRRADNGLLIQLDFDAAWARDKFVTDTRSLYSTAVLMDVEDGTPVHAQHVKGDVRTR